MATSRPEYDMQVFADDATQLARVLSRTNEQMKALAPEQLSAYRERLTEQSRKSEREQTHGYEAGV
ncbi:MAG: hypothetical protein ACR2JB_11910 [Bryobacteraceae bacterium]